MHARHKRNADGSFSDADLAETLQDATDTPARAFGPRGIPVVMKAIECLGIEQARRWGCCTLNEFRKFLGFKQLESFEEWCSVPEIAVGFLISITM